MDSSAQDKTLPATPQRLKKARADGQVPRSKDLSNLAVLGGGAVVLLALAPVGFEKLRSALQGQLRFDHKGDTTIISADLNGNGREDFRIILEGHHKLTAGDFIL